MLTEGFIRYCHLKGVRLPLLIVIVIIGLSFWWATVDPSQKQKERLENPPVQSSLSITQEVPANRIQKKVGYKNPSRPINDLYAYDNDHHDTMPNPVSNVSHFNHALTDALKVEGLDNQVSERIFKHIRSQLDFDSTKPYHLSDSVRAVLPDLDEPEVQYLASLISKVAAESFERSR